MAAVHPVAFDPSQGALNCSYCDITGAPAIPCFWCGRPPWSVAAGLVMEHEDPRAQSEGEVAMELTVHSVAGDGDTSVEDQADESQNNPWNGYCEFCDAAGAKRKCDGLCGRSPPRFADGFVLNQPPRGGRDVGVEMKALAPRQGGNFEEAGIPQEGEGGEGQLEAAVQPVAGRVGELGQGSGHITHNRLLVRIIQLLLWFWCR